MREILFRGKRIDNGEWVFGFYSALPDCVGIVHMIETPKANPDETNVTYFVDPSTVGQFTGLVDKRGSRIFEGDIVRWTWEKHRIIGHQSCYYDGHYFGALLVVRWLPAGYMLCPTNDKDLDHPSAGGKVDNYSFWNYQGGLEIGGNIHDNPELLKGGAADA